MNFFNPVLVREVRQMVRSRWIVTAMLLHTFALYGVAAGCITNSNDVHGIPTEKIGPIFCMATFAIMFLASVFAVVVQTVWRLAFDRIHEELSFYSTLTPGQHVRGRMACSAVLTALFFSMALPNLAASYLFRGIDIWVYVVVPLLLFPLVQIINLIALAIFANVRTPLQLVLYGCLGVGVAGGLFSLILVWGDVCGEPLLHFYSEIISGTLPGSFVDMIHPVAITLASFVTIAIIIPVTAYKFAKCSLSPFSANRMRAIRRWLTFVIALSFLAMIGLLFVPMPTMFGRYAGYFSHFDPYAIWVVTTVGILSAMLIIGVCERETWEGRVRRDIPKQNFRRALAFPFYTGSINGLAWVFLHTFFLIVVVCVPIIFVPQAAWNIVGLPFACMMGQMYVFNCSMAAFGLWRLLLHHWIPRDMIWAVTAGLAFGIYAAVMITCWQYSTYATSQAFAEILSLAPIAIIAWFILTILCGYPWLRGRFLDFVSLGKSV